MELTKTKVSRLIKLAILWGSLFLLVFLSVYFVPEFVTKNIDAPVQSLFWKNGVPLFLNLESFMNLITNFGSVKYQFIIASLFGIVLLVSKRFYDLFYFAITYLLFNLLVIVVLKPFVARPRPDLQEYFFGNPDFVRELGVTSFPSGHSTSSMLLYGAMILIFANWINNRTVKYLVTTLLSLLIILVGLSRIYLGVHYPTDVVGGFLIGLFGLTVMLPVIYKKITKKLQN